MDANFGGFDFGADFDTPISPINSQIRAEIEASVKKGIEASLPRLFDEAWSKLQASILSLFEGEMKKQLQPISGLVEEAVKSQLRDSIPVLSEEANRVGLAFPPVSHNLPQPLATRAPPEQAETSNLHLQFEGELPKSFFTKDDIKDQGALLKVVLLDQFGNKVDVGPEASAHIEIFVVDGDDKIEYGQSEKDNISKYVVLPRDGKPELLKGNLKPCLEKGVACISEIAFTDNSKSMRNGKFKLGAKVIQPKKGVSPGVAIEVAVSDAFTVKEHRNMFNRKQEITLDDEVWHLVNIGKGKTHEKLKGKGVHFVKDLLYLYNNDVKELQTIFGGKRKKLKETIEMAKSCSESTLTNQSRLIADNSRKQLVDMSYEKQSEQNQQIHYPSMTNLTAVGVGAEVPNYSIILNPIMPLMTYQGSPEMQSDDSFTNDSLRELVCGNSTHTALEEQTELLESHGVFSATPTQAECSSSTFEMYINAAGAADQGVMLYPSEETALNLPDLHFGDEIFDLFDLSSYTGSLCPRRRWHLVGAVLRFKFRIVGKLSVKGGRRAGKRQKRS